MWTLNPETRLLPGALRVQKGLIFQALGVPPKAQPRSRPGSFHIPCFCVPCPVLEKVVRREGTWTWTEMCCPPSREVSQPSGSEGL